MRLLSAGCAFLVLSSAAAADGGRLKYNRDVRPILSENCFFCHGPDASKRKAGLRLDDRESALEKDAIVPGKSKKSELVDRINRKPDEVGAMPEAESHKKLTEQQKAILARWIDEGAEYEPHWAYVPLAKPEVPQVQSSKFKVQNPIDAFILAELGKKNLTISGEAERRVLVRRVFLDLLGVPPTPDEVAEFLKDERADAFEKLVDRLLARPEFGERLAVLWLDLVRYADTVGYHGDQNARVFPYRDYVINSFNTNKPFDKFATEQLAGDLLRKPTPEQLVATGFHRLNMMTREGGAQPKEYIAKYQADRVRTVSMAFLGSTMGCAECHDHKFDPFTAKDFYSLSAFFADIKQWGVYQDYGYTPNPDLRGWSNDHPFPPEIQVESPYLKKQLLDVYRDFCNSVTAEMDYFYSAHGNDTTVMLWDRAAAEFRKAHPDGWKVVKPAWWHRVEEDGRVIFSGPVKRGGKQVLRVKPGAGWVASMKLELLPDKANGNRLARDKSTSVTVVPSVVRRGKDGKETKLPLFYGIADKATTYRYFNNEPIQGLLNGWRTVASQIGKPHAAKYAFDTPILLSADDELIITLTSDAIGCARISVSPFPIDDLDAVVAKLKSFGFEVPPNQSAHTMAQGLLATADHEKFYQQLKPLRKAMFELMEGKAWTQVTLTQKPITTRLLPRGNWMDETAPVVLPATPGFLKGPASTEEKRLTRLDLANWIVAKENPLTARVFVNRLWKMLIGTGLCASVEDVGAQGEWPSHPELLDWMASEFQSDWDVKKAVRGIVVSQTYRQSSKARPEVKEFDPNNRLLSFLPPRRLEAEFVRDNALSIAGLLNRDVGGPSAKPYQPAGYYANLQFPDRDYLSDRGPRQYRRGVYVHWQRTFLHPMLANFDAPSREECTATRTAANTPQQALTLLNDPTFVEAARVLAAKSLAAEGTDEARMAAIFEHVLVRQPKPEETKSLLKFLSEQRGHFKSDIEAAKKLRGVGLAVESDKLDPVEHAAWTGVCRVLLNLHESVTRY